MKQLAKFYGKVNTLNPVPELSYVTLKDAATGQTTDTDAVTEKLLEAGIDHAGCQFEVLIEEDLTGKVFSSMKKIEPNPINSPERVEEVKKMSEHRWDAINDRADVCENGEGI